MSSVSDEPPLPKSVRKGCGARACYCGIPGLKSETWDTLLSTCRGGYPSSMRRQLIAVLLFFALAGEFVYAESCPKDYQLPGADGPHHIPENIALGMLISNPAPKYPTKAKLARIQGTVVVSAVITVEGRLASIKPLCGEPILVEAVLKALPDWLYKPYEKMANRWKLTLRSALTLRWEQRRRNKVWCK